MDDFSVKLNQVFPGKVVRKDLTKKIKVTNLNAMIKLLKKYKPKDQVVVTINTYDAELDTFLSREYKIELGSKNEETYEFVLDLESLTSKMNHYHDCYNQE